MAEDKDTEPEIDKNVLHDREGEIDYWKLSEEKNIREPLSLSYTERFKLMMRLMIIGNTLSRAKITHKKMP